MSGKNTIEDYKYFALIDIRTADHRQIGLRGCQHLNDLIMIYVNAEALWISDKLAKPESLYQQVWHDLRIIRPGYEDREIHNPYGIYHNSLQRWQEIKQA